MQAFIYVQIEMISTNQTKRLHEEIYLIVFLRIRNLYNIGRNYSNNFKI
jgi:hypothetical protein